MTEMTIREVLEQSKANIQKHWICGAAGRPGVQCCAVTAISETLNLFDLTFNHTRYLYPSRASHPLAKEAIGLLYEALPKKFKKEYLREYTTDEDLDKQDVVIEYNDTPKRTRQDIVELYERAIASLDKE